MLLTAAAVGVTFAPSSARASLGPQRSSRWKMLLVVVPHSGFLDPAWTRSSFSWLSWTIKRRPHVCGYLCSECLQCRSFLSDYGYSPRVRHHWGYPGSEATTASTQVVARVKPRIHRLSAGMGSGEGTSAFVSNADFTEKPQCFPGRT